MKYKKEQRQKHADKGLGKLDGNLSGDSDSEESYTGGGDSLSDCGNKSQGGTGSPDSAGMHHIPPGGHMPSPQTQTPSPVQRSHHPPNVSMAHHYPSHADNMYAGHQPPPQSSPTCLKQSGSPVSPHPHMNNMNIPMNGMNSMNNNINMGMHNGHHAVQSHYLHMNQNSHNTGYNGGGHHYMASMNSYHMYPDVNTGHEDPDHGQMSHGGHMIPSPGVPCGVGGGMNGYGHGPYDYIPKLTHL